MPLNDRQRAAAALMAAGMGRNAVAARIGVSSKTVSRWKQLADFKKLIHKETDPTVRSTLEAALTATKRDGTPDWPTRVSAAKALNALPDEDTPSTEQPTVITIYADD